MVVCILHLQDLVSGPCLLLLLRRDNAASCFCHILKRLVEYRNSPLYYNHLYYLFMYSASHYSVRGVSSSDIDEMLAGAIVPDSTKMAKAILTAILN